MVGRARERGSLGVTLLFVRSEACLSSPVHTAHLVHDRRPCLITFPWSTRIISSASSFALLLPPPALTALFGATRPPAIPICSYSRCVLLLNRGWSCSPLHTPKSFLADVRSTTGGGGHTERAHPLLIMSRMDFPIRFASLASSIPSPYRRRMARYFLNCTVASISLMTCGGGQFTSRPFGIISDPMER